MIIALQQNPKTHKTILWLFSILMLLLIAFFITFYSKSLSPDMSSVSIEYLEDADGSLQLSGLLDGNDNHHFSKLKGNALSVGRTTSTWWMRLKLKDSKYENTWRYITYDFLYSPSCILYEPIIANSNIGYIERKSGYLNYSSQDYSTFFSPSFELSENVSKDSYIYLRISPNKSVTGNIALYTSDQYCRLSNWNIIFLGVIFGLYLSLLVFAIFAYFSSFKDEAYFLLFILIIFSFFSFFMQTGLCNIFSPKLAPILFEQRKIFSSICNFLVLLFMVEYFKPKLKWLKALSYIILFFSFLLIFFNVSFNLGIISPSDFYVAFSAIITYLLALLICLYFLIYTAPACLFAAAIMITVYSVFSSIKHTSTIHLDNALDYLLPLDQLIAYLFIVIAIHKRYSIRLRQFDVAQKSVVEKQSISKERELEFLRAQIKPHFLYNSITAIAALCLTDPKKAKELISNISAYLRQSFDFSNCKDYITLEEEQEYISTYVNIQKVRFGDKFTVKFNVDNLDSLRIPPFILQPLVENAIRHGLIKNSYHGEILIEIKEKNNSYFFSVSDNGKGMDEAQVEKLFSAKRESTGGIGLPNINRRLLDLYDSHLICESHPGSGTKISFYIPKTNE